jgi:hypothetical protein
MAQRVSIYLTSAPEPRAVYIERIDETHADTKRAWHEMGEPEYLSAGEVALLDAASRVARKPLDCKYENGIAHLDLELAPHTAPSVAIEFGENVLEVRGLRSG